ncbi:uncharacterized protein UDID_17302 [Ustilago sp. UG-2017a]|nr:uncharacterized protein UDID_17302 [Ustilago sp. UG-2017a]
MTKSRPNSIFLSATHNFRATLGSPRFLQGQNKHQYAPFDRAKGLSIAPTPVPNCDKRAQGSSSPKEHTHVLKPTGFVPHFIRDTAVSRLNTVTPLFTWWPPPAPSLQQRLGHLLMRGSKVSMLEEQHLLSGLVLA